jgi:hypothetical protein
LGDLVAIALYHRAAPLAALVLALGIRSAAGQTAGDFDTRRANTTRSQLAALLVRLDSVAGSRASADDRTRAQRDAARLRTRLAEGDFQMGDRILLRVAGEAELSDTFTVEEGRVVRLPMLGEVPLTGVLRSELEVYLRPRVGTYIRNPVVRALPLIRVAVVGEVNKPGFYLLSPTSQVEDALMTAGGPTRDSKLNGVVVQRSETETLGGEDLQRGIAAGRTLDDLGVRSGDRLFVPRRRDFGRTVSLIAALVTIPASIYALTRVIH